MSEGLQIADALPGGEDPDPGVSHLSRKRDEIAPKPAMDVGKGAVRVDLATGVVIRADGASTVLRPKAAQLLAVLAERSGEMVSKDRLLELVWPNLTVDEDGLVQCVGEIRRALGDTGRTMLRTHNKRGYSLHLPLAEAAPVAAQRTARTGRGRMLVLLALAALALAAGLVAMTFRPQQSQAVDTPVIAIFPFEPQDADPQWTRLATALTRDVIADLAQSRWLRVLGDATTRPEGPGTRDSAQSLGADFFVTGALQEEAGTMRISAALVETQSGRQVWSRNIEGPADDFLALQRQASEALAGELAASWTGPITEAGRFEARRRGIDNLDAYALFLLAGEAIGDYSPEALAEATRLLEQVVVIAPEFGEAWAKLSQVTYSSVTPDMTEAQMMALWDRAAAAALEGYRVAPQDPHAVAQAANAIRWNDPVEAERLIRRAAELEPNNADMLAFLAFRAVHYPALAPLALEWMERAMMLNPRYPPYYDWNRGFVLVMLGRYREAADALALAPDHAEAQAGRVAALALAGDESGAEAELVDLLADYPDLTAVWLTSAAGLAEPAAESFERGLRLAGAPG